MSELNDRDLERVAAGSGKVQVNRRRYYGRRTRRAGGLPTSGFAAAGFSRADVFAAAAACESSGGGVTCEGSVCHPS